MRKILDTTDASPPRRPPHSHFRDGSIKSRVGSRFWKADLSTEPHSNRSEQPRNRIDAFIATHNINRAFVWTICEGRQRRFKTAVSPNCDVEY